MKKKLFFSLLTATTALTLFACNKEDNTAETSDKLKIVTSFYPMKEFTKQVVGDEAEVSVLVKPGVEPHDFEPSAKDVAAIQDSDAFVYNNENMETWVEKTTKDMKDLDIIKASEGILLLGGSHEEEDEEGAEAHTHALDPHVWLAPSLAIKEVENIRDELIKQFPKKKAIFTKNAATYLDKLEELDQAYHDGLANAKQKNFVTQHAAFAYLALEYGLNQVSVSGLSPDAEPSATRLKELKAYVEKNDIKYIYFEENASDKVAKTLADEANVKTLPLNPLESLTKEQEKSGEDYISVMTENLKNLEKATNAESKVTTIEPEKASNEKTVHDGYFEDSQIKDRPLSDYAGSWQSVYPLLQNGDLDQVMRYKSWLNQDKTAEEYKAYYEKGYKSDVEKIVIKDDEVTFYINGQAHKAKYKYAGKIVLDYGDGSRGVRFTFEAVGETNGAFKYFQFSDHNIAPVKAEHFHIYYGNESQAALAEELTNWPTYYPANLSPEEVAQEMIAH
jgi:zinc transport system substrate-binding protein